MTSQITLIMTSLVTFVMTLLVTIVMTLQITFVMTSKAYSTKHYIFGNYGNYIFKDRTTEQTYVKFSLFAFEFETLQQSNEGALP